MIFPTPWRRLAGWLLELWMVVLLLVAGLVVGSAFSGGSVFFAFVVALSALWLYFAGFESSRAQTTLPGRLLGTKVTDLDGHRLTFARATARHFAMYITALTPFSVGYLMAFWTRRRQTLHDYLASTLVVRSP